MVGFSVIDLPTRANLAQYTEQYEPFILHHINKSLAEGQRVRLFSFCEYEHDANACDRLLSRIDSTQSSSVEIVRYDGDIDRFLALFQDVDMLFASRFHAAILGILYRIPTIPVVYSDKTINVLNDIKYKGDIVDIRDMGDIYRSLNAQILDSATIEELRQMSQTHFRGVDRMLNNDNSSICH